MNAIAKDNDLLLLLFLTIMLILFLLMIIFPYTASVYIRSYYFMNRMNPYIRKKEGKELNTKLEGLRKYLKEFSILNEKEYQELIMWKEYLIYSVIFNQNNEIIKEMQTKIHLI